MPRYSADGGRIPTTLFEAAAFHQAVKVTCRGCKHSVTFAPHGLWWLFHSKGWDDRLRAVAARMRCDRCSKRRYAPPRPVLDLVVEKDSNRQLPLPPIHEWKRMVNRFRN